jgi:hypothetical protein
LLVRSFGLHAFIFLRPFAPPALPGFNATMDALTPDHRPCLEDASAASCLPWRPMLRRGLDGLGVVRPLPLVSSRRDSLSWPGIPVYFAAPSVHSASNHPLPSRCDIWCFQPSGLPSNVSLVGITSNPSRNLRLGLRHCTAGSPRQKAESSSRWLIVISRYCGLDVRLRLLPTPPRGDAVTFSYEGPDSPRRGLSPRGCNNITGAQCHALAAWIVTLVSNLAVRPHPLSTFRQTEKKQCHTGALLANPLTSSHR